jgi:FAD/FMN-containing dehydrogenase
MKKKILITSSLLLLLIIAYLGSFIFSYDRILHHKDKLLITDVARLVPVKVHSVDKLNTVEDLKRVVADAKQKGLKISIAGAQHSQGGHTYYEDAVVLDMTAFNKVLNLDTKTKVITVQSGTRWKDIQAYANPYGLAVKVMQSSYVFTIGGTLSANAHGRDTDSSSVVETVKSFRLLTADGNILNVSRTENPDLFKLAIGGYGLFGVILDVDIQLTEDDVYEQKSTLVDYKDFPGYFANNIKGKENIKMFL